jgi:hypothetical protein
MNLDITLLESKRIASSNQDLLLNKIDASDLLGDRMFDLKSSVHLKEKEALMFVNEEFNSTSALVAACSSERNSLFSHFCTGHRVHVRRGCFLNNFLIPSLD